MAARDGQAPGTARRGLRRTLGRVKRRLTPRPDHLLPPATRLDERPDLQGFDIGKYSWGHLTVSNRTPGNHLTIGRYCSFAYDTHILLGGEHRVDHVTTYRFGTYPPFNEWFTPADETVRGRGGVTIGNDVWVGHQGLILSGVTIGDGAVIGAGSVVRSNVPPYAIALGNPARVAGFRFPKEQIEALLRIRWWDWPEERIVDALDLMMSEDIARFVEVHDPGPEAHPAETDDG